MLQRFKFWVEQSVIEIRKHFFKYRPPPPPVSQQKLLPVYVLLYFTHCMEVACWHKGGGECSAAQKPQHTDDLHQE